MRRRKVPVSFRLTEAEETKFIALMHRVRMETFSELVRAAVKRWFDAENEQRPITLPASNGREGKTPGAIVESAPLFPTRKRTQPKKRKRA